MAWQADHSEFSDQVARAREIGSHAIIEETRDIADDGSNDYMARLGRDGQPVGWVLNGEHVQRSRLRIEQRWREAEAILPKVYGKKQQIEHSGSIDLRGNSEELMAEILDLLATGRVKLPGGIQLVEADEPEAEPEEDWSDIA